MYPGVSETALKQLILHSKPIDLVDWMKYKMPDSKQMKAFALNSETPVISNYIYVGDYFIKFPSAEMPKL